MPTPVQTMTAEELFRLNIDQPCELIDGELYMNAPAGGDHGEVANTIAFLLTRHVRRHKLGRVFAAETGYLFKHGKKDTVLAPDVSFVKSGRLIRPYTGYLILAPDLAVEVVSPSQSPREVSDKVKRWLRLGVAALWVVWPDSRTVVVHRLGRATKRLSEGDLIEGGRVVPGFVCDVSEFFE